MTDEAAAKKLVPKPRVIGRYALFGEIAAGGMATVHFGRLVGPVGFSRTVAIKRLHPQYAKDPEFVGMFLDEARLASRIQHPNVVTTLDVVNMPNEVFLVMEYVQGESLSRLLRNASKAGELMPPGHVATVMAGMLHGLHAAHEAKSERREPLNIVHRDVSPQNVLVGIDGTARVLDFGVAKAAMRSQSTRDGQMKGKLSYMSPEQLNGKAVDRRTDIFAAGIVLWESLTARRLFDGSDAGEIFAKLVAADIPEPKSIVPGIPDAVNAVVMKALERDPDRRYQTARQFAIDLEGATPLATPRSVGEWVERIAGVDLERRARLVADIESIATTPEELAGLDEEDVEQLDEVVERSTASGVVQPVSGSRPRIPPPPLRPPAEADERSAASLVGASTSKVTNLVISQPQQPVRQGSYGLWIGAAVASVGGGVLAFLLLGHGQNPPAPVPAVPMVAATPVSPASPTPPPAPSVHTPTPSAIETVNIQDLPKDPPEDDVQFEKVPSTGTAAKPARAKTSAGRPAKPAANLCNPPFLIDANGIKRLKPGCL